MRVIRRRGGYLLAEALVMIVLSVMIGAAMCAALVSQMRLARSIADRVARNDASRSALHILPTEMRTLDPLVDVRASAPDSIAARWIRSSGIICAVSSTDVWLRVSGIRLPDPSKDSLIITTAAGDHVLGFDRASLDAGGCGPSSAGVYRIRSADVALAGGAVLVFESGTYYLSQRALRYRVGAEGRQPLTDELMRDAGSTMLVARDAGATASVFRLTLDMKPGPSQSSGRQAAVVLPFVNERRPR